MTDSFALPFGLVRQPDRRQTADRRESRRGGRRASDRAGLEVSFAIAADEELAQVVATWGPLLRPGRIGASPLGGR